MQPELDYEAAGLTPEILYDVEQTMTFWLQHPHKLFLEKIVHELREEITSIKTLTNFIRKDENAAQITLKTLAHTMTVDEVCEQIMGHYDKMKDMLNVAWYYSQDRNPREESEK